MSSRNHVSGALLLHVLRDREQLRRLSPTQWSELLLKADTARLLPRLANDAARMGLTSSLPDWARDRLASARVRGDAYTRDVWWEIRQIQRALRPLAVDPVFLKGAAYIAAGLPCGVGRVLADVDVLVPEDALLRVQAALQQHGWRFAPLDQYDERYYREWMHELPPLMHQRRGTVLDVHHAILPRTGRVHPPPPRLLEKAVIADGVRVLSPPHMVLHSAAHLFQDGEVAGALRDLADIHDLLTHFRGALRFWEELASEADSLQLRRPLYYAVRYVNRLLGTSLPDNFMTATCSWAPSAGVVRLMDGLVIATLTGRSSTATLALYVRSHWMRMPPRMLMKHLATKAWHGVIAEP